MSNKLIVAFAIVVAIAVVAFVTTQLPFNLGGYKNKIIMTKDQAIDMMQHQSTSTKVEDIEEDLDATELNDLDKEVSDIETEINSVY